MSTHYVKYQTMEQVPVQNSQVHSHKLYVRESS